MPRKAEKPVSAVSLTAVVVAVTEEVPRVLVARRMRHDLATPAQQGDGEAAMPGDSPDTLPYGPFDPVRHRTLELGLRGWVAEQTGIELPYVEQLYTFGNQYRDPRELTGEPRLVSVAYLVLTHETPVSGSGEAHWHDIYAFLPWEDWRAGRPTVVDAVIRPSLARWVDAARSPAAKARRRERVAISFGFDSAGPADVVRTLDRYELLYEAGLVLEALRDRRQMAHATGGKPPRQSRKSVETAAEVGAPMALDNRRILAAALGRMRGKLAYRPVVFELLPPDFTLLQLQRVVEALTGTRLHKQNFRRTIQNAELVEPVGRYETAARGRPAELFRFRRDVLTERPAVGVGLPAMRAAE